MKQYVLDESPSPDASTPENAATERPTLPPQPWPWRALLVLALVEPLALGGLYLALSADAHPRPRAEPATSPPTIAAFAFPGPPGPTGAAAATAADASGAVSRIAFERGKYVIDLRSTDIGPALAMLADATKATVRGADVLARAPTRLSRSAVVATPAEAWQAVLGDVANFAISCTQKSCAVFVTALAKGDPNADPRSAAIALAAPALRPADADGGAEVATADPLAGLPQIEALTSANKVLTPVIPQAPANGESEN